MIKPQDILLTLKLQASGKDSFDGLGKSLGISASQAHSAAKRAIESGLIRPDLTVRPHALLAALTALKYFYPPQRGGLIRGRPTGHAVEPMRRLIVSNGPMPVWPDPNGEVAGEAWQPLYKTASQASSQDAVLYEYLALVDCLRYGRAREVELAKAELCRRLGLS